MLLFFIFLLIKHRNKKTICCNIVYSLLYENSFDPYLTDPHPPLIMPTQQQARQSLANEKLLNHWQNSGKQRILKGHK